MVIFNDLRITEDKECLIVDCYIEDLDGYEGMYIDTIDIDYYTNVTNDGTPSEHAISLYKREEDTDDRRAVRVLLRRSSIVGTDFGTETFDGGLFFVTVRCDGTPTNASILANYSCTMDETTDTGVVLDWQKIYEQGMGFASRLANICGDPCGDKSGFEAFILLWYALQLAISTCDFPQVRKLWPRFLRTLADSGASGSVLTSGCGCGR